MDRQQISRKTSPSFRSTPISKKIAPSRSYGSLSSVVQRLQQDPNSVSGDERQQLESAIGTRATREILAGKQTPWVPEFQGISAQLWGDSGQEVAPIQAKLTIGAVGDKYEQEADRIASQVVEQINAPASAQPTPGQSVQRQEESEEEIQAKPSISDLQMSPLSPEVQREAMPEEEDLQAKSILQHREAIGGGEASTDLESAINRARGSGQPLDAGLQQKMGQAMGADFSGVKVHTDAQADQLNQSIQAKAFTTGQDVFFRSGAYEPGSRGGQELIAHELTHVVQQSGDAVCNLPHSQEKAPLTFLSPQVIQRTRWVWNGTKWEADGPIDTPYPSFQGGEIGAVFREEPTGKDPYAEAETLGDRTVIDYPALVQVMNTVEIGVEVKSSVWRKMRQDLSNAITLPNKSHPAHGSNFDKNQRPEQQIVDWAKVISGELKEKLATFFRLKYGIYLT